MHFEQLGPYRIGRQLGRGGMGTVFAGVESASGEAAAIKVLSAALAHVEGFRERFESEIESLRKLRHPNIVRLLGFGEQDGLLFYAMELVEGKSLEEEFRSGRRFDWDEVTDIGIQVCRALKHAHDRGVIHRDIKPANLMYTAAGEVKLSDFGIAKLFGNSGLTADGGVLGTAEYMAPEQADGRPVSHRCDLYSLGGVMYALLARRPPFKASSLLEMLQLQRFAEAEPVRRFAPDTPRELEVILANLMEKDPERRVANAQVLARRLEAMKNGLASMGTIHTPPPAEPAIVLHHDSIHDRPTAAAEVIAPPESPRIDVQRPVKVVAAEQGVASPLDMTAEMPGSPTPEAVAVAPAIAKPRETPGRELPLRDRVPTIRPVTPAGATGRFTTVPADEDRALEIGEDEEPAGWISPQTWVLALSILVVGLVAWYLLQPPSADRLYQRIMTLAEEEKSEQLIEAEGDIKAFLTYYPSDPRGKKLVDLQDEIELYHLERKFENRIRRRSKNESLSPIERAYMDAISIARNNPELGLAKIKAIIAVYPPDPENATRRDRQCWELARREAARLSQQVGGSAKEQLQELELRLDRADELATSDLASAQEMWRGVIELYSDKPWAAQAVKRAQKALAAEASADKETPKRAED
jgi:serine/threonine protein kinase